MIVMVMMIVMVAVMMAVDMIILRIVIYDGRMQIRICRGMSRSSISPIGAVSSLIGGSHHVRNDHEGGRYNNDDDQNGQQNPSSYNIHILPRTHW